MVFLKPVSAAAAEQNILGDFTDIKVKFFLGKST